MKKIKVGTKVIIKDLGTYSNINGVYVNNTMHELSGQEMTIKSSFKYGGKYRYRLEEDENAFTWDLGMFEEIGEENMEELELRVCDECSEELEEEDMIYVEQDNLWLCKSCYEDLYCECDDCNEVIRRDDAHWTGHWEDHCVCDNCIDSYVRCEHCGDVIYEDDARYSERDGCYYCEDCYDEYGTNQSRIYDYHEFDDWNFYKSDTEENVPFYIGHELEVENPNYDDSCIEYLYENLNVILAHDGSLNSGYEIISHPQSYKYILEHKEDYKKALDKMIECGYKSHNTNTCGLHFHVSRPFYNEIQKCNPWGSEEDKKKHAALIEKQNEVIDRIILVMETYKEELTKFSRRTSDSLGHWAQFLSDYKRTESGIKSLYYIKKNKTTSNRYMALNLTNSSTIEFRIFRGTLKFETFMASVELVNNIMTLCSDLSLPIEEITWSKLIDSEYAKAYCDEKDIHTDKVVVDNSLEEIRLEQELIKNTKALNKILKKLYNLEVKRVNTTLRMRTSISDTRMKLCDDYSRFGQLRNLCDTLNDFLATLDRDKIDMNNVSYYAKRLTQSSDYGINWNQSEEHKTIKKILERYI